MYSALSLIISSKICRWFLGHTCCDACGRLFVKGNYCPVCLKVYFHILLLVDSKACALFPCILSSYALT